MLSAELQLHLSALDEGAFAVEANLLWPGDGTTILLATEIPVVFDYPALLALSGDGAAYGQLLTAQLFADPRMLMAWERARTYASARGTGLSIRLHFAGPAAMLHSLAWETLVDPRTDAPLALSEQASLARVIPVIEVGTAAQPRNESLHALVAVAAGADLESFGLAPIDVSGEVQRACEALAPLPTHVLARADDGRPVTLSALLAALRDGPQIVYLIGHGTLVGGQFQLWLEDERGACALVAGDVFSTALAQLPQRPLLVILGACYSAEVTPVSLAIRLVQMGSRAVLAFQGSVGIATVVRLVPVLLRELMRDGAVDRALAAARSTLDTLWWQPTLFVSPAAGPLIPPHRLPPPDCPFPGMLPFRADDSKFFYGREEPIRQLLELLRYHQRLLVIGPSGSGKSSLIAAGLLPRLATSGFFPSGFWAVLAIHPGPDPSDALNEAFGGDALAPEAIPRLLAASVAVSAPLPARRLLLVVDQLEELFSQATGDKQIDFCHILQHLGQRDDCVILLVMRSDFFSELMSSELWPIPPAERIELTPLRGAALREAIVRPAADVGVVIAPELVERLLADAAGEPGVLPLLQEVLRLLWERMQGRRLTLEHYQAHSRDGQNGLAVAITTSANRTLALLSTAQQQIVPRIMVRLVQYGEGRANTRREQRIAALRSADDNEQDFEHTLDILIKARLLTAEGDEGGEVRRINLAHEALLESWAQLRGWVRSYATPEQTRRIFEARAVEWAHGRGGLLGSEDLAEVERWQTSPEGRLVGCTPGLGDFIAASRHAANPGWSRRGLLYLSITSLALAALVGLVALLLGTARLPGTLQSLLWLGLAMVLAGLFVVVLWSLRGKRYAGERFSQRIATSKTAALVSAGLLLLSGGLWAGIGAPVIATERYCTGELGIVRALPEVRSIAVVSSTEPRYAQIFLSALGAYTASLSNTVHLHPTGLRPEAARCRGFFNDWLVLRADYLGRNNLLTLTINDGQAEKPSTNTNATCNDLQLFAAKAVALLKITPATTTIVDISTLNREHCELLSLNSQGYTLFTFRGRDAEAEQLFKKAILQAPDFATAYHNLGLVFENRANDPAIGNPEIAAQLTAAAESYATAARLFPDPLFLHSLGNAYRRLGRLDLAAQNYQQAIAIDPDFIRAYNSLGVIYRDQNPPLREQAVAQFRAMEQRLPSVADPQLRAAYTLLLRKNHGILHYQMGGWKEAISDLEQAGKLRDAYSRIFASPVGAFDEEITYYLAAAYQQQSDSSRACILWQDYQKIAWRNLVGEQERRTEATRQLSNLRAQGQCP